MGSSRGPPVGRRRRRRSWGDALLSALRSERTAWAVQNALGAAFAAIFVVVARLQFTIGCLCVVLYSASSLVLSLDRSVGGRLFGGMVFIGTVLTGASIGGGLVSLAWLAHGDTRALIEYLPADFQEIPSLPAIQRVKDALAWLTAVPLPPLIKQVIDDLVAVASRGLYQLLPPVSSGYWALLMVLAGLAFLPLAAARADRDFGKGIIIAILFVFLSSMFVFGSLVPAVGPHLFWTEVVVGYFKVAAVAAAANIVAGLLVATRSAHDDLRRGCAALFRGLGLRMSRLGTAASGAPLTAAASASSRAAEAQPGEPRDKLLGDAHSEGVHAYVDSRVAECCAAAAVRCVRSDDGPPGTAVGGTAGEAAAAGLLPLPEAASDEAMELAWAGLQLSMKTARLEPPLPVLVCSQGGSSPAKYGQLQGCLQRVQRAVAVLGRGQAGCLAALSATDGGAGEAAGRLRAALGRTTALAAAACAGAGEALGAMPVLRPCSGAALRWRLLPAGEWEAGRAELAAEAAAVAQRYQAEFKAQGLDFALALGVPEHRALLFCLSAAAELLDAAQAAETAAAAALDVPVGEPSSSGGAGSAAGGSAKDAGDVEAGKAVMESDGAASGKDDTAAVAEGEGVVAAVKRPSLVHRLAANPYLSSCAILLLLASPLPAVKLTVDACARVARALPGLLCSSTARRAALRNPLVHYGLKFWVAMTGTVVGIIAIMWKAVPSGDGPLQDAQQQLDFFTVWQPIYASITVAICLQDTVESSLFRGVLRTTMTVLGGALGYLVMLNGELANNPYWAVAWLAAFSALAGLLAPDRTLRYSLFLFVFTANGVVACQYIGCCNVAGDPKVFAGKVVSTVVGSTIALAFGWLLAPWYASQRMLSDQADALRAALSLLRSMLAEVADAAAEGRAVRAAGWLEVVESDVQGPLARVGTDMELNILDRRQMPLTWHLLPDPAVLRLEQGALCTLRDRLASAALVLQRDLFSLEPEAGSPWAAPAAAVVPGPVFTRLLPQLMPQKQALLAALDSLVEACADNMTASAAGNGLRPEREAVAAAVDAALAARSALHRSYLEAQPEALAAAGGHSGGDFACQAWLHAVLRCADEMVVVGSLLLQEVAQDRDVLGGWVRAWRGHRAPPA